ncbi:MAG: hypothetical protein IT175_01555, partial [Acidobacteria bacterium]|nr:hypothetical protein [Acidobacteriota bacterium]
MKPGRPHATLRVAGVIALLGAVIAMAPSAAQAPAPIAAPVSAPPVHGPDPVEFGRPAVRAYTDRDGLPQNSAMAMAIDARGYLWVATQDGLATYNGRAWTVMNLPDRTVSNFVRSMIIASDGSIWCGRENGG